MRRFRMVIVKVRSQMVSSNNVPAHSRFEKALLHVAREVRPQSKRGLAQKAFEFVSGIIHYHHRHRHQATLSKGYNQRRARRGAGEAALLRSLHRLACVTHAPLFWASEPPLTFAQTAANKSSRAKLSVTTWVIPTPCWTLNPHVPRGFPVPVANITSRSSRLARRIGPSAPLNVSSYPGCYCPGDVREALQLNRQPGKIRQH